jgi:hypothetical protein
MQAVEPLTHTHTAGPTTVRLPSMGTGTVARSLLLNTLTYT